MRIGPHVSKILAVKVVRFLPHPVSRELPTGKGVILLLTPLRENREHVT